MFEPAVRQTPVETKSFLAWFGAVEKTGKTRALEFINNVDQAIPELAVWHKVPQGGKWHCEGPKLADHVARILSAIYAIGEGASLFDVEEFAREKDLELDILHLEAIIRDHQEFLCAFAVLHDIGKSLTCSFDAPLDSVGAKEGFLVRQKDTSGRASDLECLRYDKLCRAYAAKYPNASAIDVMVGFYQASGIAVHYHGHETFGAQSQFSAIREAALKFVGLSQSHHKMLVELIRHHIDVIQSFTKQADRKKYEIMAARAGQAGLNVNLYLDLMLAVAFLDAVAGSVGADKGKPVAQTVLVLNILRAEREALPRRHVEREEMAARAKKQAYKDALASVGLDGESVFSLLNTPLGPVRGTVMAEVMSAMHDPTYIPDFGAETPEILRRVALARERLVLL